ncbi:linoleate 9S-lipoxygenase 1-like [Typha latifolia]|uniref:linoleate 9S-lipoxygenase 1-like n=1 Tax=Typha latifolia TaxID=4733 RepID=UPI003C2F2C69
MVRLSKQTSVCTDGDAAVEADVSSRRGWKEVREVGHGDMKDEPWWTKMQTVSELTHGMQHHHLGRLRPPRRHQLRPGYLPNHPTIIRRFMPEPGTADYAELEKSPDKVFPSRITSQLQTIVGVSLIEISSPSDEVYLGRRDSPEWTADQKALEKFKTNVERHKDGSLKNRNGPVKMPYTLLVE